jgi:hypothetical protein
MNDWRSTGRLHKMQTSPERIFWKLFYKAIGMLEPGNKLLIAHRRMFESEQPRYFVGEVVAYDAGLVKLEGYSFARDNMMAGAFLRKDDIRIKIVAIVSGTFIVYQLPDPTDVHQVRFEASEGGLVLTDGDVLNMNLTEMVHSGRI